MALSLSRLASATALGLAALGPACAHIEAPPGGPEDRIPPSVVATIPAADTIVPGFEGPVVFNFDERISERDVEDAVIVSPRTSPVEVSHGRSQIRVSLRNGWRPDVIYHVTLRPQIQDLFNNRTTEPISLVFSTGPAIPETALAGRVTDRITTQAAGDTRVEAIRMTDSLVYAITTDTQGGFTLNRIPEGEYRVRSFEDLNRNRALDVYEPRDSTTATIAEGAPVEVALRILPNDSTAPAIESVASRDSVQLQVEFDDYLDPEQELAVGQVTIEHPEDGPVAIGRVGLGSLPPADTLAPDTAAAPAPPAPPPPAVGAPDGASTNGRPTRTMVIELEGGSRLEPGVEYRVAVIAIRNLNGLTGDSEVTLAVPDPTPDP